MCCMTVQVVPAADLVPLLSRVEQKGVWSPRRPPAVNDRLMGSMRATKSPQTPGFKVLPITKNKTSGPREA